MQKWEGRSYVRMFSWIACWAGLTGITLAGGCADQASGLAPMPQPGGPAFGVYDPAGRFRGDPRVSIDHIFIPWLNSNPELMRTAAASASSSGRSLLVTLEPFYWDESQKEPPDRLRDDVLAGRYDEIIDRYCGVISELPLPVMVRWGHEMESRSGRYPWAGWEPGDYIRAYRHFVTRCRASASDARFVWSPLGLADLVHYFPGRDYVDIVGLSVYGLQAYDQRTHGRDRDFFEVFGERYAHVAGFGLPVMIAELGYSGDAAFVSTWARQALWSDSMHPAPIAVVYFNAREVAPWPDGLGLPDWRVDSNIVGD